MTIVLSTLSLLPRSRLCPLFTRRCVLSCFFFLWPLLFCIRRNIIQNQFISSEKLTTHIIISETIFMVVRRSALCASIGKLADILLGILYRTQTINRINFASWILNWIFLFRPHFNGYPTPFTILLVQRTRISIAKLERYTTNETVRLH